ncbi:tetratricopeptide repeat protein [Sorangium cellulosum]|uniref:tetratricopeptide repeat protein n=1 Tax=Sorangium cellulosum TaxID=56 RepID=UPI0012DB46F7|nr:tetratricopeptide repeat protein [Sorangium cellulosum]
MPELRFFGEGADGAEEVARFLAVSDRIHPLAGAVIPDGVALVDTGGGAVVASLNMARDVLGKLIRGPLVLVIAADRAAELSGMAPDLFDVRAATLEIASVPGDPAPTFALHSAETRDRPQARSQAELQAEAARLRAFADDEIPAGSLADAWLRLGRAFLDAAELGEARAAAEEARRLAEGVGYTSGVGDALALEAQVLEQTGPAEAWEQALRRALVLRREAGDPAWTAVDLCRLGRAVAFLGRPEEAEGLLREAIGLFEKLGEVRGRAVALGCIADLLERRGQLDEALRIRQQEELPVHERLGDVRSRAVTLGKVADIYHAQGRLDEAQRLLEREVLPVHERTGAVRLRAITLGQIAGVLQARGELDKALHLLEREVLPVLDRLGDIRSKLCCETNMAIIHLERHAPGDSEAAAELLRSAGRDAERLRLPEAAMIRDLRRNAGLDR